MMVNDWINFLSISFEYYTSLQDFLKDMFQLAATLGPKYYSGSYCMYDL